MTSSGKTRVSIDLRITTEKATFLTIPAGVALKIEATPDDLAALGLAGLLVDILRQAADRLDPRSIMSPDEAEVAQA